LIERVFSAELIDLVLDSHKSHFKDPVVQLNCAQLWETFLTKHTSFFKSSSYFKDKLPELSGSFTESAEKLMTVHLVQWKYLSCLMHLFKINAGVTVQAFLAKQGPITLQHCFTEGAADVILLQQLLLLTLTFAREFRFLSVITRDEAELPGVIQKALKLQDTEPSIRFLGQLLMERLMAAQ